MNRGKIDFFLVKLGGKINTQNLRNYLSHLTLITFFRGVSWDYQKLHVV